MRILEKRSRILDPTRWTEADRCLIWLGLLLALFGAYLHRTGVLQANPGLEPYFDRAFLAPFRFGLTAVTAVTFALFLAAAVARLRATDVRRLQHASCQLWWIAMPLIAYALGPVTTPILGLLSVGGLVSIPLFPRRVITPAVLTGMTILIATTIATERGMLPYAPLFVSQAGISGPAPGPYVTLTAAVSFAIMLAAFAFTSHVIERGRAREHALITAGAELSAAREHLEQRIAERTAELSRSNERLTAEAAERRRVEAKLRESETQLREQFTELEHLYRNAPIGLCMHDPDLNYVRINERMAAINGHSVAEHIGQPLRALVPELADTLEAVLHRVLETGEPALDIEVTGSTSAEPETERHWLTSYYPVKAADGTVLGVSAVVQDISELKRAENRERRHLADLAHVSRLSTMGQMATGIAHELNQPLAAITNYAHAGKRKAGVASADEIRDLFDKLGALARRAGEIVHRLRGFVNKPRPDREAANAGSLIRDVLPLLQGELHAADVQPTLDLQDAASQVHVDTIQIQQVVVNLVRNAIEALTTTPPAARRLRISTRLDGAVVETAIEDNGEGISQADLARIFDAFYTTKDDGMGLGLGISRSIVEAHGGRLWGETNPDGGTTFKFTLPTGQRHGDDN